MSYGTIEFIIIFREPYPYNELKRQRNIKLYPSLKTMIDITTNNSFKMHMYYELVVCNCHITILIYDLLHENIIQKFRFNTYDEYCNNIESDALKLVQY